MKRLLSKIFIATIGFLSFLGINLSYIECLAKTKRGGYVMNNLLRLMLVFMLMIVAVPAYSGEALQMWKCEIDDDTSEEEVLAMKQEWLKAARKIEGGVRLEAYVYFPVAVNATGEVDALFVVVAPPLST